MADEETKLEGEGLEDTINSDDPSPEFLEAYSELEKSIEDDDHSEGSEAEADETPDDQDDGKEEIPEHLVAAGRSAGLDDDAIIEMADKYPKALEALAQRQVVAEPEPEPVPEELEPDPEPDSPIEHVEVTVPEGMDANTKAVLETMAQNQNLLIDKLNEANKKLGSFEEESAQARALRLQEEDRKIDEFFDAQVDLCPALGTNETLTDGELAVRQEVYDIAEALKGGSLEERLGRAVKAYNGMTGEAEQNISRKLYKQKERFTPRPSGKKMNKQFASDDDKAMAALDAAAKEMGIDLG